MQPENKEQLAKVLEAQTDGLDVPGFIRSYMLFPEEREDEVLLFVIFEDRDYYMKNADDPAQDERYREYPCASGFGSRVDRRRHPRATTSRET